MGGLTTLLPVFSKAYCSHSPQALLVRRRPRSVGGGGFVVMSASDHTVLFAVDGCCALGVAGECVVRDGDGNSIIIIRKEGGVLQAMSFGEQWRGYAAELGVASKLVFSMKEQKPWLGVSGSSSRQRIILEPKMQSGRWDFDVRGSFADRDCTIRDRRGNLVAEIKEKDITRTMSKEFYHVMVQPGFDQAFVVAVIAILDYINGESTRC